MGLYGGLKKNPIGDGQGLARFRVSGLAGEIPFHIGPGDLADHHRHIADKFPAVKEAAAGKGARMDYGLRHFEEQPQGLSLDGGRGRPTPGAHPRLLGVLGDDGARKAHLAGAAHGESVGAALRGAVMAFLARHPQDAEHAGGR